MSTKRECRCCKRMFKKDDAAKFGICQLCEGHVVVKRYSDRTAFVLPEKCPSMVN